MDFMLIWSKTEAALITEYCDASRLVAMVIGYDTTPVDFVDFAEVKVF